MKKSKRILVLILTLVMSLPFNVALAGDDVPVIGWEKPEETLKFTAYMGQGDPQSDIDTQEESGYRMKNWLKEEMNVEIELQRFMDAQEQRISLMMLDGSYPELLAFTNEAASAMFIESGHALDLAPLLEQYGQNILAEIGDYVTVAHKAFYADEFEKEEADTIQMDMNDITDSFVADAVMNGITDEQWNAFQQNLQRAGVERYTAIWQASVDKSLGK